MVTDVQLEVEPILMAPTIVSARSADEHVRSLEVGSIHLKPEAISEVPVFFGEQDVLKTVQLLPGVSPGREGESGFTVRGGGAERGSAGTARWRTGFLAA